MKMWWKYLITNCVVLAYVYGEVEISPRQAVRHVGDDLTVFCKVLYPIESCRVTVGTRRYQLLPGDQEGDVVYAGWGLEDGECGAHIRRLYEEWNGTITCEMRSGSILATASMHLLVTRSHNESSPQIFIKEGTDDVIIEQNQTQTLRKSCKLLNVGEDWKLSSLRWLQHRPQHGNKNSSDVNLAVPDRNPYATSILYYTVTEADDNSSIYCVAQFFSNTKPLVSPPIKIRVNRKPADSPIPNIRKPDSTNATMIWTWIVGALGVLCGAALIGALIYRKRQKTTQTCADNTQEDPQEPVYSYVPIDTMPLYAARALLASNTQLGPAAFVPALPPPREGVYECVNAPLS